MHTLEAIQTRRSTRGYDAEFILSQARPRRMSCWNWHCSRRPPSTCSMCAWWR